MVDGIFTLGKCLTKVEITGYVPTCVKDMYAGEKLNIKAVRYMFKDLLFEEDFETTKNDKICMNGSIFELKNIDITPPITSIMHSGMIKISVFSLDKNCNVVEMLNASNKGDISKNTG
jgi:hypothetical protein